MAINKVVYNNRVLMDITDTTATPENMLTGTIAYGADGNKIVGEIRNATSDSDGLMSKEDKEALDEHIADEDIHVTAADKLNWNSKVTAYRNASGTLVFAYSRPLNNGG